MPSPIRFRALAIGLLVITGLAVALYWHRLLVSAEHLREGTVDQHSRAAARLAAAAGTQTEALFHNLDSVLIHLRADFLTQPQEIHTSIQAIAEGLPKAAVPQIGVIDAEGHLIASSLGVPEKIYLGDREHFRIHASGGFGDRLFISTPVLGRRSGTWSIQLSRRLEHRGRFLGMIVASVSSEYLASQLARFELGPSDTIALFRQDGIYLARHPKLAEYMGRAAQSGLPFFGQSAPDSGTFRTTAGHESVERLYAWRRLKDLPLVAVAGFSEADFLAPVEADIRRNLIRNGIGSAVVLLLAGTAALLILLLGRKQRRIEHSEVRFRTLFEALPEGIMLIGPDGAIEAANDAAVSLLGADRQQLDSRPYQLHYPDGTPVAPEDYPSRRCLGGSPPLNRSLYALDWEGARRWISVSSRRLPGDPEGGGAGVALSIADVTRLVELEESLRVSQSVFLATTEGIFVANAEGAIISVNPAFSLITGYSAEEVVGRNPRLLKSGVHDDAFYRAMYDALTETGHWEGEITNRRRDGSLYVEWLKINAIKDRQGKTTRYVALLSDITARKRRQEELWHRANYDALTDLPNRILFQDRLGQAAAQSARHGCRVAVLYIDLDRFKAVNDRHGHSAGDELLRQAARRISNCLRDEDTVARVGGDEFLVLLPSVPSLEAAHGVAEKILEVLKQPFAVGTAIVTIGASIGIGIFPDEATTVEELLALADRAMYDAKAAGRGAIRNACPQQD